MWFFGLFRAVDRVAATAVMAFGLVNATAVLASVAAVGATLEVAGDPGLVGSVDTAGTVGLL